MSERFFENRPPLDVTRIPEWDKGITIADFFNYFKDELPGRILTTHYASGGANDIVRHDPIVNVEVDNKGKVSILKPDAFGQPDILMIDGTKGMHAWSIYEPCDFWFCEQEDDPVAGAPELWYGIYDTPLIPEYISLKED